MKAEGEMRIRLRDRIARWIWVTGISLAAAFMPAVCAQTLARKTPTYGSAGIVADPQTPLRTIRQFRDPHTGVTWLVERDPKNPAGPGRMVAGDLVSAPDSGRGPRQIVIRAGDRVVVEEHGPAVEASLEAVALGRASAGSRFNARLEIGGKVVRVVALAPGRAALVPSWEERP